ncbi:PH domain-containing protein [Streptomyces sp. NPDC004134]|uniref:PH domain-containing protein n=1 Tax=Streptomyces sp. NPDC004134 TaxID=3364691 RepID=UPI003680D0B6
MSQDGLPRTYRISAAQAGAMITAVALASVAGVIPLLLVEDVPRQVRVAAGGAVLLLVVFLVRGALRCATTADEEGIKVRGVVRQRALAWAQIQDLRIEPNPGAGTQSHAPEILTCAYGPDGSRLQLPYLDDRHVDVDREFHALCADWERLRGEDWTPDPAAADRIDRLAARRSAMVVAFAWTFVSFFPLVVLMLLPLFVSLPDLLETVLAPYTVMGAGLPLVFAVTAALSYRRQLRALNEAR